MKQSSGEQQNVVEVLFTDVKRAFDYVSRVKWSQKMKKLGVVNDLIG